MKMKNIKILYKKIHWDKLNNLNINKIIQILKILILMIKKNLNNKTKLENKVEKFYIEKKLIKNKL